MHLVHETELAHGEGVGEEDVSDGEESRVERGVLRRPELPVHGSETADSISCRSAGGDDCDSDGDHNRGEVNVSQDGELGEGVEFDVDGVCGLALGDGLEFAGLEVEG